MITSASTCDGRREPISSEDQMSDLTMANIKDRVGSELGVSKWLLVDQERIERFAECTEDWQWIHVDPERAKRESPFKGPIAHGYLTLSLVGSLSIDIGCVPSDAIAGFNYGLDKARFLAPVPSGARVRLRVVLDSVEDRAAANCSSRRATRSRSRTRTSPRSLPRRSPSSSPENPRSERKSPCRRVNTSTHPP